MHGLALALLLLAAAAGWQEHYDRGRARLEAGDAQAAVVSLRRAAKLAPREPGVWYHLARALRRSGRPGEARTAAERYRKLEAERRRHEPMGTMAH